MKRTKLVERVLNKAIKNDRKIARKQKALRRVIFAG
jgi:hypothetical protein